MLRERILNYVISLPSTYFQATYMRNMKQFRVFQNITQIVPEVDYRPWMQPIRKGGKSNNCSQTWMELSSGQF